MGGYKVQGVNTKTAKLITDAAKILEENGVDVIVLELIPSELGKRVTQQIQIPTIGIGAGVFVDGQVLVLHDMLGLTNGLQPKFVRSFFSMSKTIEQAVKNYISAVRNKEYPSSEHSY